MKNKTVIFDLDGTLAIIDKRKEHATNPDGKINWNEFFNPAHISFDEPNEPVIKLAQMFKQQGFEILIFSCLLYTSPSPRDGLLSRMPSSA